MFKGGQLLRSFKRCRTSLIFHKRCKVYVVDKTFLPTNLEGTAYISKFPYSVEIEPIDLTRLPDFPLACATLFIRTPGDEELDDAALEAFDKNINYKFEVGYEKRNDSAVEVSGHRTMVGVLFVMDRLCGYFVFFLKFGR